MDIQSRKLEFIQEFLKLQNEEAIERFEKLLRIEKKSDVDTGSGTMTKAELNKRIDQSEKDFENGRYKQSEDLLAKYK